MTQEQKTELEYLIDLLREASKWNTDPGDDALRLEVDLRINNILNGETTTDAEPDKPKTVTKPGEFVDKVEEPLNEDDYRVLEAAKLNEHLNEHIASPEKMWQKQWKWKMDKVRVNIDGKIVWKPKDQCTREPRDNSHGGPKWHWVWNGPDDTKDQKDVNKLSDELWEAHENGNDL